MSQNNNNDSLFDLRDNAKRNMGKDLNSKDYFGNFFYLTIKLGFFLSLISINFIALSIALNCNKDSTGTTKFFSGLFAFFFGFIYIIVNFYTYRVLSMKKICEFDKERLFPF